MAEPAADPYLLASTLLTPDEHIKIALEARQQQQQLGQPAASSTSTSQSQPSSATRTANPRRILVIVSNVAQGVEESCILVLKPRDRDPNAAALLDAIPILHGIDVQLHQHRASTAGAAADDDTTSALPSLPPLSASFASIQSILDSFSAPGVLPGTAVEPPTPGAALRFTIRCASRSVTATTDDTRGLSDFLSVLRDLATVAQQHAFDMHRSHAWMESYTDHMALLREAASTSTDTGETAVPIFKRFSKNAFPASHPSHRQEPARPPSPGKDELRLSVGTFNVAGLWPPQDPATLSGLRRWLSASDEDPDLIVLGFQEIDTSSGAYLYHSPARQDAWTRTALHALGRQARAYTQIAVKQLVGLLLVVLVRKDLRAAVTEVATAGVGVGLGGFVPNKGAVAVRFRVGRRSVAVVNAHLSAYEGVEAMERRCWDWNEIYRRMRFRRARDGEEGDGLEGEGQSGKDGERGDPGSGGAAAVGQRDGLATAAARGESGMAAEEGLASSTAVEPNTVPEDADGAVAAPRPCIDVSDANGTDPAGSGGAVEPVSAAWKPSDVEMVEHAIGDHDLIINLGDLNFRLDLPYDRVHALLDSQAFDRLLRYDQLTTLRQSGSLFADFEEGRIAFPPTYKFERGTDRYDSSEKRRVPGWTDRVVWTYGSEWEAEGGGEQTGRGVVLQRYESVPEVRFSDHRPVRATFLVRVR